MSLINKLLRTEKGTPPGTYSTIKSLLIFLLSIFLLVFATKWFLSATLKFIGAINK